MHPGKDTSRARYIEILIPLGSANLLCQVLICVTVYFVVIKTVVGNSNIKMKEFFKFIILRYFSSYGHMTSNPLSFSELILV